MAPSISEQIRLEYAVSGSGLGDYLNRKNASRALDVASILAEASGNERAQRATRHASDVNRVTGGGAKKVGRAIKKHLTKKRVGQYLDAAEVLANASGDPRAAAGVAAAKGVARAVGATKGSGVSLAGRGRKTKLQAAMCR